jgi:hypothetical protein
LFLYSFLLMILKSPPTNNGKDSFS